MESEVGFLHPYEDSTVPAVVQEDTQAFIVAWL